VDRRRRGIALLLPLAVVVVVVALPQAAAATSVASKLTAAKQELRDARQRLRTAEAALAAASAAAGQSAGEKESAATPAPSPSPSAIAEPDVDVRELTARVARARRVVRAWEKRVRRLAARYLTERQMAVWERRGDWMPIIEIAAAKYRVKADGIYRMMMRESGGNRFAGSSSAFKGLFQYWTGTWAATWNPWRRASIYDGSAQIFATCYAVSKGFGPRMWTTTFASQY